MLMRMSTDNLVSDKLNNRDDLPKRICIPLHIRRLYSVTYSINVMLLKSLDGLNESLKIIIKKEKAIIN